MIVLTASNQANAMVNAMLIRAVLFTKLRMIVLFDCVYRFTVNPVVIG